MRNRDLKALAPVFAMLAAAVGGCNPECELARNKATRAWTEYATALRRASDAETLRLAEESVAGMKSRGRDRAPADQLGASARSQILGAKAAEAESVRDALGRGAVDVIPVALATQKPTGFVAEEKEALESVAPVIEHCR